MDDISDIQKMYDGAWDKEDIRLQRHQLERDITLRFLDKYLPRQGRILEVGAGTGYYTMHLARSGYEVAAIDLAPELVKGLSERVTEAGLQKHVTCQVRDARDLSGIPREYFDAALLMGPLYHLVLREDRLLASRQASACLRPGGIIFSAFVSRLGIFGNLIKNLTEYIHEQEAIACLLENGWDTDEFLKRVLTLTGRQPFRGYFATVDEIAPLHEEAGFETIVLAGVEPCISADDESYNRLEGETRRLWLDLLFKISTEPSMVASSQHMLYIGRKPQSAS